jgi:hypothetical protein
MKIHLIVPINYEYNDEHYYESGVEVPVDAFRDRAKAAERLYDLTQERREKVDDSYEVDYSGKPLQEFYKLVSLEVPDDQVA